MRLRRISDPVDEQAAAEVARALEVAASAAPPSPREAAIREALLDDLGRRPHRGMLARPIAFAATMLLVLLAVTAVPGIVSYIGQLTEVATTPPAAPDIGARGDKASSTLGKETLAPLPEPSTAIASPDQSGSPSPELSPPEQPDPDATATAAPATPSLPALPIPTLPVIPTLPPPPLP